MQGAAPSPAHRPSVGGLCWVHAAGQDRCHSASRDFSVPQTYTGRAREPVTAGQPADSPCSPGSLLPTVPGGHQEMTTMGRDPRPARLAAATVTHSPLPKKILLAGKSSAPGCSVHSDGCCHGVRNTQRSSELGATTTTFLLCPASFQSAPRSKPEFHKQGPPCSLSASSSLFTSSLEFTVSRSHKYKQLRKTQVFCRRQPVPGLPELGFGSAEWQTLLMSQQSVSGSRCLQHSNSWGQGNTAEGTQSSGPPLCLCRGRTGVPAGYTHRTEG